MSYIAARKSGLIDSSEIQAPTKVKYLLLVWHMLLNFMERSARKLISISFAFCSHVDAIKYRET